MFACMSVCDVVSLQVAPYSAMWVAVEKRHFSVVIALAEAGADVNQRCDFDARGNNVGNTLLHIASQRGDAEMVSVLLACKASLTVKNHEGRSPIWVAFERGHTKVLTALADAGADVNQIYTHPRRRYQNDGNTFLHIASQEGNVEVVSALMVCNASLTVKNTKGQFPIDVAANDEIRQLINDEMTARFDHGLKRTAFPPPAPAPAVDSDGAAAAAHLNQDIQPEGDDAGTTGTHATAAASVASEDEDSEESSDEES